MEIGFKICFRVEFRIKLSDYELSAIGPWDTVKVENGVQRAGTGGMVTETSCTSCRASPPQKTKSSIAHATKRPEETTGSQKGPTLSVLGHNE